MSVSDASGCFSRTDASSALRLIPGAASPRIWRSKSSSFLPSRDDGPACRHRRPQSAAPAEGSDTACSQHEGVVSSILQLHDTATPWAYWPSRLVRPRINPYSADVPSRDRNQLRARLADRRAFFVPSPAGACFVDPRARSTPLQLAAPERPAPGVTPTAACLRICRPRLSQDRARAPPAGRRIARRRFSPDRVQRYGLGFWLGGAAWSVCGSILEESALVGVLFSAFLSSQPVTPMASRTMRARGLRAFMAVSNTVP